MTNYVENIISVYLRATDSQYWDGMEWYNDAHHLAHSLSPNDIWRGAGVIAALSPMKQWPENVRLARIAFETGKATGHIGTHVEYAQRILDGEHPLAVMNGDKTRNFCEAIATNGMSKTATIDRHAHDIAMFKVFTDKARKIGKRLYRDMASAYGEAAELAGISVNQMQAVTWVTWKESK